ncbi:MAG: cytochrome c [Zoogloeaceae bacterium]|nr:cytochrome c [Zoogloeaceae bacterium]
MPFRLLVCCLSLLFLAACGPVEDTRPGRPVAQRQQAFREILHAFEPMGLQLRENRYQPDAFLQYAQSLDALKEVPWPHFGPESNYPPSRSANSIWESPAGFAQERARFVEAASRLAAAAASRREADVRAAHDALQESCRACHKRFRR